VKALTVLGPVEADELGVTLVHEHLLFDFRDYWEPPDTATRQVLAEQPLSLQALGQLRYDPFLIRENLIHGDVDLAVEELQPLLALGGRTVVDPTNSSLGRDPKALQSIARRTGINIVMGSGHYTEISLGASFRARQVDDLVSQLVREVREGVGNTGVRAGLIGEIGTSAPITPSEEISLRSAARAHAATGAPLMVHLDGWGREGHSVLDIVEEEQGDPARTILCHMNPSWEDSAYQISLAERGAYIEYDMMGMTYVYPPAKAAPDDQSALRGIKALIEAGFLERTLMSQDVFLKSMLTRYGGLGYTHVLGTLRPLYRAFGILQEHLDTMLIDNPKRVLAFL
jgi:phosphotriesterase-related protein